MCFLELSHILKSLTIYLDLIYAVAHMPTGFLCQNIEVIIKVLNSCRSCIELIVGDKKEILQRLPVDYEHLVE